MHAFKIATAALLALAPVAASAQPGEYRASGTEPFWSLTIGERVMRFEAPGKRPVTVPTPRVIHGFAGEMWQSVRINVNTVHRPCSNGMSDRTFADTVTVRVDGRTYSGCGGGDTAASESASLIDGNWRIEALNGRPIGPGSRLMLRFENGRVNGNAGCNAFGGSFRLVRGRLTTGPLISTKMACADPRRNAREHAILGILGQPMSVSRNPRGKLVLTAPGGGRLTLLADAR